MNFTEFRDALFSASLAAGCAAAEVCLTEGEDFEVRVLDGALDSYSVSRSAGLGLRVLLAGKNGYAYTERFEDAAALVRRAMDNARAIESADDHPMQGAQTYVEVTPPPEPLVAMDEREKIELCREMERLTKAEDPRVQQVAYNIVSSGRGTVRIHNTLGLHAERPLAAGASLVVAVLRDGAEVRDGSGYRLGAASADVAACAKEAVREAAALMGAKSVPAGSYRVLLRNDAAASLLEAFSTVFSADRAQKGLSPLAGREGERIAGPGVTLTDDPLYEKRPRAFDDEGTPSVTKNIIESGTLKTLLHNLKTAKKANVASTSNGARASAGSPVGVSPSNLYFVPGGEDFDALLGRLGSGLVVTEFGGLHAGVNAVTGNFSLEAKGRLVENGRIVRPVDQITVAGDFLSLLSSVEAVGSDLRFSFPSGSWVGSPSLLIPKLLVSGA